MPHSLATTANLTCPACTRPFSAELWLIVDTVERPDLLARIRDGALHDVACPHCGATNSADAPLLAYRPDREPVLIFTPRWASDDATQQADAQGLLDLLKANLGAAWDERWLADGILPTLEATAVPAAPTNMVDVEADELAELPPALAALLAELAAQGIHLESDADLEQLLAARPELRERFAAAMQEVAQTTAPALLRTLDAFVRAASWAESQQIVTAHPELLAEAAIALFNELIAQQAEEESRQLLTEHRDLLERCREVGVARAFAEKQLPPEALAEAARLGMTPEDFLAAQRAANEMPPALREVLAALAAEGIVIRSAEDLEQALADRPDLRAKLATANDTNGHNLAVPAQFQPLIRLAQSALQRYLQRGERHTLEEAADAWQQILADVAFPTTPHRFRLAVLNDGGGVFLRLYWTRGRLSDLNRALDCFQQAVRQTGPESPALPGYLNNLGTGLRARYARTGRLEDLEEATNAYEQACARGVDSALEEALRSARNWGSFAVERRQWAEAIRAYQYGLTAIDRLYALQLVRTDQESVLGLARDLAARAATVYTHSGQPADAVVTMERGRARMLGEALEQNRADLALLPERGHVELYERYRSIIEQRQQLLQQHSAPEVQRWDLSHGSTRQSLAALQQALQEVIAEIQQIPGYANFLAKPTFAEIQGAVVDGEVLVYLLTTEHSGLALIVHTAGVESLWLDLTDARLRESLVGPAEEEALSGWLGAYRAWLQQRTRATHQAWLNQIETTTHHLWDAIMGPLADAFHRLATPPQSVTLIPTGLLALLPLHAAWTAAAAARSGDGSPTTAQTELFLSRPRNAPPSTPPPNLHPHYFLDDFTVRYAPSALALRHAQERLATVSTTRVLAIDEPKPVNGSPLPNSAPEVSAIVDHFAQQTVLSHAQATRQGVLDALAAGVDVAHFSCHGLNNWNQPLETGLYMAHDTPLTVRDLLELRLPGARLATLSACETGIAGTGLPDEVVMLPSALLQAGFAGVAASLWSVADVSTAMLMARFYDLWQSEGVEPVYALRQAQQWVRDTTNQEKADYFAGHVPELQPSAEPRMAAGVAADFFNAMELHEDGPEARTFTHPFWWAAFTFTGV